LPEQFFDKPQRQDYWAMTALLLLTCLMFRDILFFHTHTHMGGWDASIQSFAWYAHVADAIREGSFPFWDMHSEAGEYFIGEMQTAAFYPPNWLFALLRPDASLENFQYWSDVYLILHVLICTCFSYLSLRTYGFSPAACLAGAIIASWFGAMAQRLNAQPNIYVGMSMLPAVLYWVRKAWQTQGVRRQLLFSGTGGLFLSFCILSGHLYSYIHAAFLSAMLLFFTCLSDRDGWVKGGRILAFMGLASLLLAWPQLDASLEYFSQAYKWYGADFTEYPHVVPFSEFAAWKFTAWKTLLSWRCADEACFEGRTLYVGLTVWPLVMLGIIASPALRKVVLPVMAVVMVIALAGDNLIGQVLYHMPVIKKVRIPSRILFVFPLLVAILACAGLDSLHRKFSQGPRLVILWSVLAAGFGFDLYFQGLNPALRGVDKTLMAMNPADYYGSQAAEWLGTQLGTDSLYRWTSSPKELLPPNLGQVNHTNALVGHRSSMQSNYYNYQSVPDDTGGWGRRLGKLYVASNTAYPGLQEVFSDNGIHIYRMPDALPLVHGSVADGLHELPITDVQWRTNSLAFSLAQDYRPGQDERLFLGISWFPGWQLSVDGEPRALRHGEEEDGAFMSAGLQEGDRLFELQFRPRHLWSWFIFPFVYVLAMGWLALPAPENRTPAKRRD
jgi:hypothetical protein